MGLCSKIQSLHPGAIHYSFNWPGTCVRALILLPLNVGK